MDQNWRKNCKRDIDIGKTYGLGDDTGMPCWAKMLKDGIFVF